MKKNKLASVLAVGLLIGSVTANAIPINPRGQLTNRSFERGDLTGWQTAGDVSIQTAAIGSAPTHGDYQALLGASGRPFSGEPAVYGSFFPSVGFPKYFAHPDDRPLVPSNYPVQTFGGNYSWLRQDVNLRLGDSVTFDYNFVTADRYLDYAFLFVQSLDQPSPYQFFFEGDTWWAAPLDQPNTYQFLHLLTPTICSYPNIPCEYGPSVDLMPLGPSAVDACLGYPGCNPGQVLETGWHSYSWRAIVDGNYAVYVGVIQQADTLVPSALLVDNFKIAVPEPGTLALLSIASLALVLLRAAPRRACQ